MSLFVVVLRAMPFDVPDVLRLSLEQELSLKDVGGVIYQHKPDQL